MHFVRLVQNKFYIKSDATLFFSILLLSLVTLTDLVIDKQNSKHSPGTESKEIKQKLYLSPDCVQCPVSNQVWKGRVRGCKDVSTV